MFSWAKGRVVPGEVGFGPVLVDREHLDVGRFRARRPSFPCIADLVEGRCLRR